MTSTSINPILVIDDDESFRKRLARAFRDRKLKVFEAENEHQAIEVLKDFKPVAAVLDLKIKDESGLEILKKLLSINSKLNVVILTGYGTITTTVEALKSGAINYLTKPVDADTILAAFNRQDSRTVSDLTATSSTPTPTPSLEQVEWDHINRVVSDSAGNISKASKVLGMHRRSLQRKLNKAPSRIR